MRKVTHSKYSRSKNCSLEKSQTAVFFQYTILFSAYDNDLFSRIYALKKLIPIDDTNNMKKDIKKLINKTPVDIFLLGILPRNWEDIYDKIVEF